MDAFGLLKYIRCIKTKGVVHLTVKERILAIRLCESILRQPHYAYCLGVSGSEDSKERPRDQENGDAQIPLLSENMSLIH